MNNVEFDEEEFSGRGRCPFDLKQTSVALLAGEHERRQAAGSAEFGLCLTIVYQRSMKRSTVVGLRPALASKWGS